MSDQFKAGDVVVLKSGGPKMTVQFVEDDQAACTWFDGSKPSHGKFGVEMLELATGGGSVTLKRV